MAEPLSGPEPFLERMRLNELEQLYEETIRAQYPEAQIEQVREAAETAAGLFKPLVDEVDQGEIPYFRISTEIEGFDLEIMYGGE